MQKNIILAILISTICAICPQASAEITDEDMSDLSYGVPLGAKSEEPDYDLCPNGVQTVYEFLKAWKTGDFRTMYALIDDDSKKSYSAEQARFDFSFLEYKDYKISSIKQAGDNYEFILSCGEWKFGDKDVKKLIISGFTYKIIMANRNSIFKKSAADFI